jgi:hypothetical protein
MKKKLRSKSPATARLRRVHVGQKFFDFDQGISAQAVTVPDMRGQGQPAWPRI